MFCLLGALAALAAALATVAHRPTGAVATGNTDAEGGERLTLDLAPGFSVGSVSTGTVPERGMRVAELAGLVGLSADSIRYYERVGLLPPPARTPAGYRAYDATAVDRLHFIRGAQRLGLHLSDIRELLTVRDTGVCACEPAEELLRRRLAELDAEVTRLTTLRGQMLAMLQAIPSADCPPPEPGTWCLPEPEGGDDHASSDPVV